MSIHQNLEMIKLVALQKAKDHSCNYNIAIMHPNDKGEFVPGESTYEFFADSYFEKPRPFVKLLFKTDDLLKNGGLCTYSCGNSDIFKFFSMVAYDGKPIPDHTLQAKIATTVYINKNYIETYGKPTAGTNITIVFTDNNLGVTDFTGPQNYYERFLD